jgi:hypothetical protein
MFTRVRRQYALALLRALIIYGGVLAVCVLGTLWGLGDRAGLALESLQLASALYLLFAFARFFATADEMQRRMQGEAVLFAAGGTALLGVLYGFLERLGLPHLGWAYLFPVIVLLWLVGMSMAERRYE